MSSPDKFVAQKFDPHQDGKTVDSHKKLEGKERIQVTGAFEAEGVKPVDMKYAKASESI